MRAIFAIALLLLLSGCATDLERINGTGQRADPPYGWVDYCRRNPKDISCSDTLKTTR